VDINAILSAVAQQQGANIQGDGILRSLRGTRAGQLFVADWKTELVLAGAAFGVTAGGISAGADIAGITGGGAGTTIDTDQPELAVGTPTGFYHIPLGFFFGGQGDLDADASEANVILFADTAKAIPLPIEASSDVVTPVNLLGGGPAAASVAQKAVTTDIEDPACSQLLAFKTIQASEVTAAGEVPVELNLDWQPSFPMLFKGPCSVVACWGGTKAVVGMASYFFAEVPINRFA